MQNQGLGCSLFQEVLPTTVESKRWEYGHRMIYDGVPSVLGFGVGRLSYSNFPSSTLLYVLLGSRLRARCSFTTWAAHMVGQET